MKPIPQHLLAAALLGVAVLQGSAQETPLSFYKIEALPAPGSFDYFEPRRINASGEILGRLDASRGVYADQSHAGFYRQGRTIDLHLLAPGHRKDRTSLPVDLNDNGQLLFRTMSSPADCYFLYDNGRLINFSTIVGRGDLEPSGINASGQIVGSRAGANAFLLSQGQVSFVTNTGLTRSYAARISNSGKIVGSVISPLPDVGHHQAVLFTPSGIQDLGIPFSYGVAVNDAGHVLAGEVSATHFLARGPDQITLFDFVPTGLNNDDQVVGYKYPHWPPHAMLFAGGATHELKDLVLSASEWELLYAFDINDRGQIIGLGTRNGRWTGFVLNPVKTVGAGMRIRSIQRR